MIKCVVFDAYGTLYDVFSVVKQGETEYPGHGEQISQIWRQKQLEYTWLRTLMNEYKNFWDITRDSLCFTLDSLHLPYSQQKIERLMEAYLHLEIYPEIISAMQLFRPRRMAILTNGNPEMINPLISKNGLAPFLDATLSADSVKLFKTRPEVYQLAVDFFQVNKDEVLFVSSNGWDVTGAKAFGFHVGWINRLGKPVEKLGFQPDYVMSNLLELAQKISG